MALTDLKNDMEGCSRCSNCKWVPHLQIKSYRFAKVCPSIDRFNFHAYSGGGKLVFANSMLEGKSDLTETMSDVIYRCQLCGACQVSCQAYRDDIDLSDVLLELRAKCVEEGYIPPEHMEMLESMKREDNTLGMRKADRGKWAEGLDIPNINQQKVKVLFHAGCRYSYDDDQQDVIRNILSLLMNVGVDVGIAGKDEACCGGRAFETGYQGEMKNFAEDMSGRVRASGADILVTACSDCYYTFKYLYPKNNLDMDVSVFHITEYVDNLIKQGMINPEKSVPMRVTYHDPCHLGRRGEIYKDWKGGDKLQRPGRLKQDGRLGIFDPPRDIIRAIPGIDFIEMERIRQWAWCCGAGGGALEAYPEFANWTAIDRIEEAAAVGAEAIVTACPWCERLFKDTLEETGQSMKVYDVMALLNRSLGG
ncbi:MAG: (Fe-S)-binding protein [Desulfobacterales bacterium]|nr:(Fe-S)-binding protein [Desulfobacterales bacterium]